MYIIPNEAIQCDVLPCLAETGECVSNHSPQLAPGNLVRLDGSPTLTGLDMVDTIPAYDGPNPSSCLIFSSRQTTPQTGYKDLGPEDISGTASSSLPCVPLEALTPHDAQDDVTPVPESPMTPALTLDFPDETPRISMSARELMRIFLPPLEHWTIPVGTLARSTLSARHSQNTRIFFFSSKLDYGACSLHPFEIKVPPGTQPIQSRPYRLNLALSKQAGTILDPHIAAGLIQHSTCSW